ncbi:hypothetical protein MMPV_008284 [Pyropia vietnamensis]
MEIEGTLFGSSTLLVIIWWTITIAQYATSGVFILFLSHKALMVLTYPFITRKDPIPGVLPQDRPFVTVQLPCYNEAAVIRRVIDAACNLKWPRDRFEVHVLDDSNDETTVIAEDASAYWRAVGTECRVIRRPVRTGYKAGALQWDIDHEVHPDSQFFPVFDADFAPSPDWLEQGMAYFYTPAGEDVPSISMVQGRWTYLNTAAAPVLPRLQELILNGHFFIEQVFRSRTDRPWNFNGTAGIWRRAVIQSVGGWEHDTIVEDSDLSIKCFDAGYRGVYVRDLGAPSELPVSIGDYRSQQTRWVKGMGQVFAKRARVVLTSPHTNVKQKVEFLFHKLPSITYIATVVFQIYFPLAIFVAVPFSYPWLGVNLGALTVFWAFYTLALYRTLGVARAVVAQWRVVGVMVLSWGMAPLLASAFIEGLFSHDATFTRTPKRAATIDTESERTWSISSTGQRPPPRVADGGGPLANGQPEVQPLSSGGGGREVLPAAALAAAAAAAAAATVAVPAQAAADCPPGGSIGDIDDGISHAVNEHTYRTLTAVTGSSEAASRTTSDGSVTVPTAATQSSNNTSGHTSSGSLSGPSFSRGAAGRRRRRSSGPPFFRTKFSLLPIFEAALALWSAFAAIAAVFGLSRVPFLDPVDGATNTDTAWLVAVVVFGAGSAVGLGWNATSAVARMAGGAMVDIGRGVGRAAAAIGRTVCGCCVRERQDDDDGVDGHADGGGGGGGGWRKGRRRRGRRPVVSEASSVVGEEVGLNAPRPAAEGVTSAEPEALPAAPFMPGAPTPGDLSEIEV